MIYIHSEEEFEQAVLQEKRMAVVDFYADWCGPCKALAPLFEEEEQQHPDYVFAKVNIDQLITIAQRFRVISIPAVLVFKDGECVNRAFGLINKEEMEALFVE